MIPIAIKGGNLIHVGNDAVLLDRLQTAGPGTVNIKRTQVYELGNYLSVGQVSDIPDLSFTLESLDVSCALEALLLDESVTSTHVFDLAKSHVLNVKSAFKPGQGMVDEFDTIGSAAVPCLHLESVSYKYGVGTTNASQTATLKGDSLYYNPGTTYIEHATGSATAGQVIVTANPAYAVSEAGVTRRTLAITAGAQRLLFGSDYTESYGSVVDGAAVVTITIAAAVPTTDTIYVTYASSTVESFPQSVHALVSGVSGTLLSAATSATSVLDLSVPVTAGDVLILDDVSGSAVTETVVVDTVTPPVSLGTVTVAITTGLLTVSATETLVPGDPVQLGAMTGGAPLVAGTTYYVKTAPLGTTLTLAATPGGAAIATTTSGTSASITRQGWSAATVSPLVNNHIKAATFAQYVPTVKPAAIRGRDIDIYIGPYVMGATTAAQARGTKRHGVQTAGMDWKVTLENDEELGNYHYVNTDFEVPTVSGSIAFKPQLVSEMLALMQDLSGVADPLKSANPTDAPLLDVQIALKNPLDGRVLKRLWCPDARFSLPGYSGKVQAKLDFTAAFTSDMGLLSVSDS